MEACCLVYYYTIDTVSMIFTRVLVNRQNIVRFTVAQRPCFISLIRSSLIDMQFGQATILDGARIRARGSAVSIATISLRGGPGSTIIQKRVNKL